LHAHQLKSGEQIEESGGRVQVSGQTAVMSINALMVKIIFDKNAGHEFYIEESFPLEWMYPYLEPHGLILKINRQPLAELPEDVVRQDRDYWGGRVKGMIGDWLTQETPVHAVADFVEKTYLRKDLGGFKGDPQFVQNDYATRSFSHWRASIAGVYAWRAEHAAGDSERGRMAGEADFAYRQAWSLCPTSPDVVNRYAGFLKSQGRVADASLVEASAAKFPVPKSGGQGTGGKASERPRSVSFELRFIVDAPSADAERMILVSPGTNSGLRDLQPLYVQKEVMLDQTAVQSAQVFRDALGRPQVEFTLTDAGRKRFAEVTRQHIGKRLAIVIDGRVQSAPWIRSEITGGKGVIEGNFFDREAQELASRLNNAAK
ncbi:MAG TPA: hypothetical protein VFD66_01275, partial [Verrucomicrobiae bacterium]|nr:hypothetical protein [Verrucomicrobiae bacterium]